jgi:hypothetical protein
MSEGYCVSVYRVYSIDNILLWIYEVKYTIYRGRFMIEYLCVLLVGDDVKRRLRRTAR